MAKDYSKAGANLAAGIGRSGQKWLDAIMGLTVNPAAQAASPQGMANWLNGVQQSVGKRQRNLAKVQLADIQAAAQSYGHTNYGRSAAKAQAKYEKKLPGLTALWQAQKVAARAIPKQVGSDNLARVQTVIALAMKAKGNI